MRTTPTSVEIAISGSVLALVVAVDASELDGAEPEDEAGAPRRILSTSVCARAGFSATHDAVDGAAASTAMTSAVERILPPRTASDASAYP